MKDNQVTQSKNEVGGDLAGRDIIHDKSTKYYGDIRFTETPIQSLYKRLELEKHNNPELAEFIEELNYFYKEVEGDVIGLEKKLQNGQRDALISFALRVKERYHKKLYKQQFSEVAQKINVYLLALVQSYFENLIYPKICDGSSSEEINILIQENLINKILGELEDNLLDFTASDVNGMLYFLTGNCHIKWNK